MRVVKYTIAIACIAAAVLAALQTLPRNVAAKDELVPAMRDMTEAEVRHMMGILYEGRTHSANLYLDSLETECKGEPLFLLARARVLLELLPVDDDNKDVIAELAEPLQDDLDRVVDVCTYRIEHGDTDKRLLLLRGWAWMFKGHVRTFERSFWAAGRDAKKGKSDLTNYLEMYPEDPLALGTMGAFLYFADQIGVVLKFISKLLMMPSGDREEGLEMMQAAVTDPEAEDTAILLYSIYLLFEGRYEAGLDGFEALNGRYPAYMGFVRSVALMAPIIPARAQEINAVVDSVLARNEALPEEELDQSLYALLRFLRVYNDRIYNPAVAVSGLEELIDIDHPHPDWVTGYAAFEWARIMAGRGEFEEAKKTFAWVKASGRNPYMHDNIDDMVDDLKNAEPNPPVVHPSTISQMYRGDNEARQHVIDAVSAIAHPTARDAFYLGDAYLLGNDRDRALATFAPLAREENVPAWDHTWQLLAASRSAELLGADGNYRAASKYLETAMSYYNEEFLIDWVVEGRQRYYERLAEGKETVAPTLYTSNK